MNTLFLGWIEVYLTRFNSFLAHLNSFVFSKHIFDIENPILIVVKVIKVIRFVFLPKLNL